MTIYPSAYFLIPHLQFIMLNTLEEAIFLRSGQKSQFLLQQRCFCKKAKLKSELCLYCLFLETPILFSELFLE